MNKTVITYGTFDMFHIGHLNILKRAKAFGNYLIVGVTSEDYDRSRGKLNVIQTIDQRVEAIKKLDFVDKVIIETHKNQKQEDIKKFNVDKFVIGDDWVGKFDYLNEYCEVIYLPRTEGVSSTLLRKDIKDIHLGIVGTGRIANRFAKECMHVQGIELSSVYSTNINNVSKFISEHNILYGFDNFDNFLESDIEAVYVASPHEYHYIQSKKALESGKHVLCEKPAGLNHGELRELINLAKKNELVFLEGIKTAFFPAFIKLLEEVKSGVIGDVVEVRATFTKLIEEKDSREWNPKTGGATTELGNYPLLLSNKILGPATTTNYVDYKKNNVDSMNTIISKHKNNTTSISTVGIGVKSEGCAIISGTKGYVYIPAPWWLTKDFYVRFEDSNKSYNYQYEFEGDGLRYEISEFKSLIQRNQLESNLLNYNNMLSINKIILNYLCKKDSE